MSALLDEALELDEDGRRRWLAALPPGDQDLAEALGATLLPTDKTRAEFARLNAVPKLSNDVTVAAGSGLSLVPGTRVGPYELLRLLGRGGMAEVWLARRADGSYERQVALKLPLDLHLRGDLVHRFARERDILAQLEHPRIARLYDAGMASDGLPYLAMEYVAGQPLTDWCDARRLGIRERLELFLQVLEAVDFAHAQGVIHRDLKPSNVLVTEKGQIRLLDFGVARLLRDGPTQQILLTQFYGRVLTPEYASPEYLGGSDADVQSDIYSLGVMLHELLVGVRPPRTKAESEATLIKPRKAPTTRAMTERVASLPSTQLTEQAAVARAGSVAALSGRLRGDLDAIILKALAQDPQARYATAHDVARDIQSYLATQPIMARAGNALYRARKFLQRNRVGVLCTIAAIAASVALMRFAGYGTGPDVGGLASTTAVVPASSIAVLPFADMSEKKDQEYFSDGLAEELLDLLSRVPELHVVARTSAFSFKGKNEDIRTVASKLSVANILEGSVRKSGNNVRITVQLVKADNGYHLWSQTYDRAFDDVFKIQDEIAASVVQALKISLLEGGIPKTKGTQNVEAHSLVLRAMDMYKHSTPEDNKKAISYARHAIELDPTYAQAWCVLANAIDRFEDNASTADWEEARRAASTALSLDPNFPGSHTAMARVLFLHDWDWTTGLGHVRQALTLDPGNALALAWEGDIEIAMGHLDHGLAIIRKSVANDPANPNRYGDLSGALLDSGRFDEAWDALRVYGELSPESAHSSSMQLAIGDLLILKGNPIAALDAYKKCSDEDDRLAGLAVANLSLGRRTEADTALRQLEAKFAKTDQFGIAAIYALRGESDKAFYWLDQAYKVHDSALVFFRYNPFFKNIRSDPRFNALLSRMKLPA